VKCTLTLLAALLLAPLAGLPAVPSPASLKTDRVNMFLGSDSSAMTVPAAIRPFGMISPGPFNRPDVPCGYQMRTRELIGFNHTHLQGTGCGSYGVLVLLPTTGNKKLGVTVNVPATQQSAQPGYYKAVIGEMNITAEMTCTKRVAIHRYTFPESDSASVLIDLSQGALYAGKGKISGAIVREGKAAFSGSVHTTAWGAHTTWFYMEFSKPVDFKDEAERGGLASFSTTQGEELLVKVGISYVGSENAKLNINTELPGWDFEAVRKEALQEWEAQLAKIDIKGGTRDQQVIFYSALYHALFHPQLTSDVNRQYRGLDGNVHTTGGHSHYSVLSTWDTFRAAHPLYTLISPDVQLDVIKTMLDDFRDSGWGPRWKLGPREVFCMPGSWCDVIISDAYIKGITDFDTEAAWKLVYKNATVVNDESRGRRDNLADYLERGYVTYPNYISVTKTLEHAYCDFNIAKFAEALGKKEQVPLFYAKAKNYKKLWDPKTAFFRGKDKDGNWSYPDTFDPLTYTGKGNNDYCEGNAWQWLWHVMQDTQGLIDLMGGDAAFKAKMDAFLTVQGGHHGTREFGQYWHGNEPDQHALYAYNYVGAPAKAAEKIRRVLAKEYRNDPWGLSGNEDAGQLSAWYIFSAMGFYPYLHSVPEYTIGSPLFDDVTLHLPNGKTCVIIAKSNSAENMYVHSLAINGKPWDKTFLRHADIVNGATIEFVMGPQPSTWGTAEDARPFSMTRK
jgi:predicted alpha-1,2-mannosidase